MTTLSTIEWYRLKWAEADVKALELQIKEGIAADDIHSAWYKTMNPLSLFLCHKGVKVPNGDKNMDNAMVRTWRDKELFIETTRDLYPSYRHDDKAYCLASIWGNDESNLDLWTIHIGGNDDCSYSWDVIGKEEAFVIWDSLVKEGMVTDENTGHFYFSN